MPMKSIPNDDPRTSLEREAEAFAFATWERYKSLATGDVEGRTLGRDYKAFLDSVYDLYLEALRERKVRSRKT